MLYLVIYYTEETTEYKVRESTQTLFDVSKFKNFIRSILMRWFCENNWDSNSLRELRPVACHCQTFFHWIMETRS